MIPATTLPSTKASSRISPDNSTQAGGRSPMGSKEIQPVHPKGNQSWIFIGRTDAEAETPILWPPDAKNWLTGKDPDAGKDWRQEEKGTRGWDGWMASLTQRTWVWVNSRSWWWDKEAWHAAVRGVTKSWAWLNNCTELNWTERGRKPQKKNWKLAEFGSWG